MARLIVEFEVDSVEPSRTDPHDVAEEIIGEEDWSGGMFVSAEWKR